MFRKDPDSRLEWTPDRVKQSADRAKGIWMEAWKMLKAGGLMVLFDLHIQQGGERG